MPKKYGVGKHKSEFWALMHMNKEKKCFCVVTFLGCTNKKYDHSLDFCPELLGPVASASRETDFEIIFKTSLSLPSNQSYINTFSFFLHLCFVFLGTAELCMQK